MFCRVRNNMWPLANFRAFVKNTEPVTTACDWYSGRIIFVVHVLSDWDDLINSDN